jgi:hypothetical protein
MNSLDIKKDDLERKLDKIENQRLGIKDDIKLTKERSKRVKELEKNRRIDENGNVSEIITTINGGVIGYSVGGVGGGGGVKFYDNKKRLVAVEKPTGTFTANGKMVSYSAVGLLLLGLKMARNSKIG